MNTSQKLNFIAGKAILRKGRSIVAKVFFRPDFFKGLKVSWDKNYPYSLEISGMQRECKDLNEVGEFIEKYV